MLKLRTWWGPTAHGTVIYLFNFQSDEPGAQWYILICISMQYGPAQFVPRKKKKQSWSIYMDRQIGRVGNKYIWWVRFGLTSWLRCRQQGLWRWHRFGQWHAWNTCFLLPRISNTLARDISPPCHTHTVTLILWRCLKLLTTKRMKRLNYFWNRTGPDFIHPI